MIFQIQCAGLVGEILVNHEPSDSIRTLSSALDLGMSSLGKLLSLQYLKHGSWFASFNDVSLEAGLEYFVLF